ncbi:PAS domain S-box-containing protein/diguanylate cyclase (GGDEF) domain-containing protein [Paraburkholderia fungorum]|uniref:PAS domain S-box-containing protein/diguanylate cyclase (GGDEF) domain-containing protein n=1 Tax=Paraburkholderia fungorum TaxID=134537 RepID=A0A1H1H7Z0_9BURK|nr:GGDEF and EAL domain-containing protein [Paraburkholderia fungorum]SDR21499.1 PAS domain S-box-containing protein/diguanylate cyclase (GGDEF) domain-containing protein [Paraburkholderia fungorum]
MRFKAIWHPKKFNPNRSESDPDTDGGVRPARNQRFLSYFLSRYGQRKALPIAALSIAMAAGLGVAALVHYATSEAVMTLRLALSIAAGAAGFAAVRQKLRSDHARQCAAIALASGLLNSNRDCLKVLSADGKILRVSEYGAELMEARSPEQLAGADWLSFWTGDAGAAAENALTGALEGASTSFTGSCATTKGHNKWWNSTLTPVTGESGAVVALLCASEDVTQQCELLKTLRDRDELMHEMESHVHLVFYSYSSDFERIHHVSAGVERVFGITPQVLAREPSAWLELVVPEDAEPLRAEMRRIVSESAEGRFEYRIRRADGSLRWIRSTAYPVRDESGNVVRIVGVSEDITLEQERLAALDRLAHTDGLTGLANRSAVVRRMKSLCSHNVPFGLMFIDLDRFKVLNDTLGHTAADRLLKGIAEAIREALPSDACVARLGGDEFAVIISDETDKHVLATLAQSLLDVFSSDVRRDHSEPFVTASIGISMCPEHGRDHETLLTSADIAMYEAKRGGRNGFRFADKASSDVLGDFELERSLPMALASGQFVLHFQGIHEPASLAMKGVEALMRWNHPTRGMVGPGSFIPILEESGFIVEVGAWVVDAALAQLASWRTAGKTGLCVSVNVSARQLRDDTIVAVVDQALRKHKLPPRCLEIELTESALMDNPSLAQETLMALKRLGVRIAIDDFGTGYSSLRYLADFSPDIVKIDRSFTAKLGRDAATASIVRGIIQMSHELGMKVTAEGVETEQQLHTLRDASCDYVQGYFLTKPTEAGKLMDASRSVLMQHDQGSLSLLATDAPD